MLTRSAIAPAGWHYAGSRKGVNHCSFPIAPSRRPSDKQLGAHMDPDGAPVRDDVVPGAATRMDGPTGCVRPDQAGTGRVELGGTFHAERLVWSLEVELLHEGVEAFLLLQSVRTGWPGRFLLQVRCMRSCRAFCCG